MTHFGAILEAAPTGSPLGQYGSTIIMVVVLVVVFYFFLIRPENKKKKQAKEMRDSLSVGDDITTIGGLIGKVVDVSDDSVTFETS